MIFRRATLNDLPYIREIINDGKKYLHESGVEQWTGDYPSDELLTMDITSGYNYLAIESDKILGTAVISFDGEPTYDNIYDGSWLTSDSFIVIHRLAVKKDGKNKNIASKILDFAGNLALENNVHSIKIDTHTDNSTMKRLMEKNGFTYCGIITLSDNSKRIAFEKILK